MGSERTNLEQIFFKRSQVANQNLNDSDSDVYQKLEQSESEDHLKAGPQTLKARLWIAEDQRCRVIDAKQW